MRFLSLLESVVNSTVAALLMMPIGIGLSNLTDKIANPSKNAYFSKCVYESNSFEQKALCDWVNQVVDEYDKICNNCMKKEGSYPVSISWSNQSKSGTLGVAHPGKFKCDIELAIDEDWVYDGGMKFKTTVLHEIGHCYGLEHDMDTSSLMYPSHNPSFTEQDVLRFVERLKRLSAQ